MACVVDSQITFFYLDEGQNTYSALKGMQHKHTSKLSNTILDSVYLL
jgi:hypothetical protein